MRCAACYTNHAENPPIVIMSGLFRISVLMRLLAFLQGVLTAAHTLCHIFRLVVALTSTAGIVCNIHEARFGFDLCNRVV